jgi:hypothetical protein
MRCVVAVSLIACLCCAASGCTAAMPSTVNAFNSLFAANEAGDAIDIAVDESSQEEPQTESRSERDFMALVDGQDPLPAALERAARRASVEEIVRPPQYTEAPTRRGTAESDLNRIRRRIDQVPLDIRPAAGTLPTSEATIASDRNYNPDYSIGVEGRPPVICAYTPRTLCFRPLYFEEIGLERYGASWGIVQPAISGAHFFGRVAAMPYKMFVRCPRSCVCSNGFSRVGDLPPPDYGDCCWSWSAAAFEAGIVAGIVIALP